MSGSNESLRIAVFDDDSGFVKGLSIRFEALGWQHRVMSTPVRPDEVAAMKLDAIVLDPAVAGPDPWAYIDSISGLLPGMALIICSQGSTVAERVRGLRLGADDWVAKPCHPEEVVARVEAITRRRRRREITFEAGPMVAGEVEIRPDQFQAFVSSTSVGLTRREFELLSLLAEHSGKVLEREAIYERVWGYAMAHGDRSVDVFIRRLRNKLQRRSPGWDYVHTHFGVGYRFDPEPITTDPNGVKTGTDAASEPFEAGPAAGSGARSQPFHSSATTS